MANALLGLLVKKLDAIIANEVNLIGGATKEFRTLQDEINQLKPYIRRIYRRIDRTNLPENEEQLLELAKQLHKVYWRAEDAVDIYLSNAALYERKTWAKKILCLGVPIFNMRRQLSVQSKEIKEEINRIISNKHNYEIDPHDNSSMAETRTSYIQQVVNVPTDLNIRRIVVEEGADVVGFEDKSKEVMKMLLLKQSGDDDNEKAMKRRVVSIIGMGGLGKSTLAMKIYNNFQVNAQFSTKVWAVVSQNGNVKDLLINILEEMRIKIEHERKDDIRFMKRELSKALDNKCYLIVLDDIWTPQLWEELKMCLPADQKNGSRIILTSRVINVANAASTDSSCTYEIEPLGDDESWLLFCKKALKGNACPDNLVKTGKDIVSKCKGLPLTIVVLGGTLSAAEAQPSLNKWSQLLEDTSWHNECSQILSLSYQCLPVHLKICFLYVGVFPEDYEISARELCWLWVAEGFIPSHNVGILCEEDVAMQYLIELVDRNLIIVRERGLDGGIKYCGIHDLIRECCINEAVKSYLYEVNVSGALEDVNADGPRRLVVSGNHLKTPSSAFLRRLRTLLFFGDKVESGLVQSCYENLAVARVLRVSYHDKFKKLILLRYLSVRTQKFKLPSLSKMVNLQILFLDTSEPVIHFPDWLWDLKHLRHISVQKAATIPDARSSNDKLMNLQTLENICIEKHMLKLISNGRFPNLRKIGLYLNREVFGNQLHDCEWIGKMVLQSLEIENLLLLESININLTVTLELGWDHHCAWAWAWSFYKTWVLDSRCTHLPGVFSPKLTDIRLYSVWLTSDQWMQLGNLENLHVLCLLLKYPGDRTSSMLADEHQKKPIEFKAGAFPRLISLKLISIGYRLELEDGALISLQNMSAFVEINIENEQRMLHMHWSVSYSWVQPFYSTLRTRYESNDKFTVEEAFLNYNYELKSGIRAIQTSPKPDDHDQVGCSKNKGYLAIY